VFIPEERAARGTFDVVVVGGGHAGCEAALAAARMGCRTALITLDADKIALMPCNPSIGGPGKGHLVREIDALGGEMGVNADRTSVQIRRLNTGKGPAVQSIRVQSDKVAYGQAMRQTLLDQANLDLVEASVDDLLFTTRGGSPAVCGVVTSEAKRIAGDTVVLTTGTFLRGRIIMGEESFPGGRAGEFPADALSQSLARAGFTLGRLKTGTPPRVERNSIDFSLSTVQEGSPEPLFLSYQARRAFENGFHHSPSRSRPVVDMGRPHLSRGDPDPAPTDRFIIQGWRSQLNCFLVQTNHRTHDIIRDNLHRAPMYNGEITATGPRYCPSIEAKIVRFADKPSHQLFLEPEGWHTDEIYVQGANTSLPVDIQVAMLRTVPAMAQAKICRPGYAIEYDYLAGTSVRANLESKPIAGLFLAGQIIGTTGYEEAAALGLMGGINAARFTQGREAVVLRRDQAYIGVLVDDLVTKDLDEPYRMHTSQAEYRLLLREDSAEARLSGIGHALGLVEDERYAALCSELKRIDEALEHLDTVLLTPTVETNRMLESLSCKPLSVAMSGREALRRADITPAILQTLGYLPRLPEQVAREVETSAKYEGYISRQASEVARLRRMEDRPIPDRIEYDKVLGLRAESLEKLRRVQPRTIGQAARIGGVPPSDVALVLFHIEKQARASRGPNAA